MSTDNWNNFVTGLWTTGSNWSVGTPPTTGDDVTIPSGFPTIDSDVGTVSSLAIGTPNNFQVASLALRNGGKLAISGNLAFNPQGNFATITLSGNASVTVGGSALGTTGDLVGAFNLSDSSTMTVGQAGVTTIDGTGVVTLTGPTAFLQTSGQLGHNSAFDALATNNGSLNLDNGAVVEDTADLVNNRFLFIDRIANSSTGGSVFRVAGTLTNQFDLDAGNNTQTAAVTVSAASIANTGGSINLVGSANAATTLSVGATAGFGTAGQVDGEVILNGNARLVFASGTIDTINADGAVQLTGTDPTQAFTALSALDDNEGSFSLSGTTFATAGDLINQILSVTGGSNLTVAGQITNKGSVSVASNSTISTTAIVNAGSVNVGAHATLNVSGAAGFGTAGVLTGALSVNGGALVFGSGSIGSIAAGASLSLFGSTSLVADASAPTSDSALSLVSNAGAVALFNDTSISTPGGFTNSGSMQLDNAAFQVTGRFVNAGTVAYVGSDTVSPSFTAASLVNRGSITLTAGSHATAAFAVAGTVTNSGAIEVGSFPSAGAQLNAGGALANTGTLELDDTASISAASFSQSGTGIVAYDFAPDTAVASVSVTGAASLAGSLQIGALQGIAAGHTFTVASFAAGQLTGMFHTVSQRFSQNDSGSRVDLGNGKTLGLSYNATAGTVQATVYATPTTYADNFASGTGDFSAANWDNGAPVAYSDLDIGTTSAATVTVGADATVNSVLVESSSQLDLTGSASLYIGSDANSRVFSGGILDTSGSTGSLNVAGTLNNIGGLITVGSGVVQGDLDNDGTLEIKSGTFTVQGHLNGAGTILVDAGATLVVGSTQIANTIVDDGTIDVANGTVNFDHDVTGTGAIVANANANADLTGNGPALLGFNGSGGTITLDDPAAVTSGFENLASGDAISFAGLTANAVTIGGSNNALMVTDGKGNTLSYAVSGPLPTTPFSLYSDLHGGTLAIVSDQPTPAASGGTDNAPAIGVVYDGSGSKGVLSRKGSNYTLAFSAVSGQAASPFHIVATNQDSTAPIDAQFALLSGGGTGSDVTDLGGGATSLTGIRPGGYNLSDGTPGYGPHLQVSVGTPTVYTIDSGTSDGGTTFPEEKLTILYGLSPLSNGNGTIDSSGLRPSANGPTPPPPPTNPSPILLPGNGGGGHATGDVHYLTFDGIAYDLQLAGEFVLVRSTKAGDNFQIQVRTQPSALNGSSVSITKQVAIGLGADRVTVGIGRANTLMVNGVGVTLSDANPVDTLAGGTVTLTSSNTYRISSIGGETVELLVGASNIDVTKVLLGRVGSVVGLLGTDTGLASRDFTTADGTVLPTPISKSNLDTFGNSWRITDATSLLDYGSGESTATFQNTTFPTARVPLSALPDAVVTAATAAVDAAGITDPTVRANAILDYAFTNDATFIANAKVVQQTSTPALYTLTPTGGTNAATGLGVMAPNTTVRTDASGTTTVTFTAYATAPVTVDTVVNYAVVQNGAGYFTAADFGGTLPSGSTTIVSGATSATFTVAVPNSALGALASDQLRVQIGDPAAGLPTFVPTADVTVASAATVAGTNAAPTVVDLTAQGTLSGSGTAYTLDFGTVNQGDSVYAGLGVANAATPSANALGGSFDVGSGAYFVSGIEAFAGIAAGGTEGGLNIVADTTTAGAHSEIITLHPTQANASGFSASLPDISLTINDTVIAVAPVAPTITGTVSNQPTSSEHTLAPFSGVTIMDANRGGTETLTIAISGAGGTLGGAGALANGVYTLTGSPAAVTTQLDAVTFTPTAGAPNASSTSTFTLGDKSSAFSTATTDNTTTVVDSDPAVAPTITGTHASTTTSEAAVAPFSGVQIADRNTGGAETLTIAIGGSGGTLNGAGMLANGVYTLTGSAADVTSQLDAITFTPTVGAPNTASTSTFMLSDESSVFTTATTDGATTVVDSDPAVSSAVAPTITGTHVTSNTSEAAVTPFSGVQIGDGNTGGTEILTIEVGGSGGTLTGAGTLANGVYTLTGSAAAVTSQLDAITFTPTAGAPNTASTSTFALRDTSSASPTPATDNATEVIDSDPASGLTISINAPVTGSTISIVDPTISGTTTASGVGSTITLTSGQTVLGSTIVASDGSWSDHVTLPSDGTLTIVATDTVGGVAMGSASDTFTLDSTPNQSLFGAVTQDVTSPGGQIYALYETVLGRAPDASGFENQVTALINGTTLAAIAQGFLSSPEYAADHGSSTQSDSSFITQLYQDGLHRAPDPAGLQSWEQALEQGGVSRTQVAVDFAISQESQNDLAPVFAAGVFVPDAADAALARLYDGLLGRAPDAGGLQHYEQLVHGGSLTLPQVAQEFLSSPEYETTAVGQSNAQFITGLYQTALGRTPGTAGRQHYELALDTVSMTRADVVADFLSSTEFKADTAADDDATYVNKVYAVALGRQAEPGGLQFWEQALATGTSRTMFDQDTVSSAEFKAQVTDPSQALFVNSLYEGALGRTAGHAGLQHYEDILSSLASPGGLPSANSVAFSITQSPEAQAHLAPRIELGLQLV